jgi:hypothetical protein
MRLRRTIVATAIATGLAAFAPAARAADVRFAGDEARVAVDEAGVARVEHTLAYRVSGGLPKAVELNGVEPEATIDPAAQVTLDGAACGDARLERKGDRALRVTFDPAPASKHAALRSGLLSVHVAYTVDLVKTGELAPSGALWRVRWTAPVAPDGYDAARMTFDLPAAPTEPRVAVEEGSADDDGRTATLKRGPQRDELRIERPHVSRGEAATWTARIDPRALPRVTGPAVRPTTPVGAEGERRSGPRAWWLAALVGVLYGALVGAKHRAFGRACEERGVEALAIVPRVPRAASAWVAAVACGFGVALQASSSPMWGSACIAAAMAFAVVRATRRSPAARGPGQWLALSPSEAFAPTSEPGVLGCTDAATDAGKWALVGVAAAAIGTGAWLALVAGEVAWGWLVPLDALALLPLFVTGSRAQLPPDRAIAPRGRLAAIFRLLKRDTSMRVAPWARVPTGATAPDELRLLVLPRAPMPGVVGIEVGVAWSETPAGYAPETEVLVRVRDATAAAARLVALAPLRRAVPGRKTDERVVRIVPSVPSRGAAVAVVRYLVGELRDRRKSLPAPAWGGAERRLPPNERMRLVTAAAA